LRNFVVSAIIKFGNEEDYEHFGSGEAGYLGGFVRDIMVGLGRAKYVANEEARARGIVVSRRGGGVMVPSREVVSTVPPLPPPFAKEAVLPPFWNAETELAEGSPGRC
jgi:hypothetical protein